METSADKKADFESIRSLLARYKQKRYQEAVEHFLAMDEEYQHSKVLAIFVLAISLKSDDWQLHQRIPETIAPYFVWDYRMALLLLDYYFIKGDYDQVVALTKQLEREFGVEEARLLVVRANARIEQGRYREAFKYALHAVELEPENEYGYWSLFHAQLAKEDYATAVETARTLERQFDYDMGATELEGDARYADFVASAAYRKWRAGR